METLSIPFRDTTTSWSKPLVEYTTLPGKGRFKHPLHREEITSLRRTGLHRLTFRPIALAAITEKMGYRDTAIAVLAPENKSKAKHQGVKEIIALIQQQYPQFDFTLYADRLVLTHDYPIHCFYFIEVPYQKLRKSYPQLTKLLVTFLSLSQKIGLSLWDEHYYTGSAVDSLDEQIQAGEWEEEEEAPLQAMIDDAKALSQAIGKCSVKRVSTLKRHLRNFVPTPQEQPMIQALQTWTSLLEESDSLTNYDGEYAECGDGTEVIPPSHRFVISPVLSQTITDIIDCCVQEAYMPEIMFSQAITHFCEGLAIPLFPFRVCQMVIGINEAIEQLSPTTPHD
ncbi:hypothetical protein [Tunicatimonas pelagia]|uniref:hypothetical protein n=1 Tax=Tunicatimonas pelagia TaxID=931531 RepID=UPI002665CD95|nr:hypothetical protein [Tunicatimonas pelagia]WKN46451.1 hypothetical protein P0M28_30850 [Tunicatimonas pelagia]